MTAVANADLLNGLGDGRGPRYGDRSPGEPPAAPFSRGCVKTRSLRDRAQSRPSRSAQDRRSASREGFDDPGICPSAEFSHSLGRQRQFATFGCRRSPEIVTRSKVAPHERLLSQGSEFSTCSANDRLLSAPVARLEKCRRRLWVGSGSSIYAFERPPPRINLTFTWKRPTTGHLVADRGRNLWRD